MESKTTDFYLQNNDFREYVDKYCKTRGYTVGEALTHELVRQICLYYMDIQSRIIK